MKTFNRDATNKAISLDQLEEGTWQHGMVERGGVLYGEVLTETQAADALKAHQARVNEVEADKRQRAAERAGQQAVAEATVQA